MTTSLPDTTARRKYVADIDASLDVLQRLHDDVRANGAEMLRTADTMADSIGKLSIARAEIMDGIWADEARARSSRPDGVPESQIADNGRLISGYDDPSLYRFDMSDDEWASR